jgi:hypothetical protein
MPIAYDVAALREAAEGIRPATLPARIAARLRATTWPLVIVACIAALSHALWGMPYWWGIIQQRGFAPWFHAVVLPDFVTTIVLLVSIRASADNGTALAHRPGRFLLVLALGAIAAEAVMSMLYVLLGVTEFLPGNRPLNSYLIAWLNSMLFGALFGWLGILYLQRTEDQARFSAAMTRHMLLARQVTQSRLIAARAQIDPELVASILRHVRNRYSANADEASALLDQLIGHLRLAMSRVRDRSPSPAAEIALIRSYLALRETESGVPIAFHAGLGEQAMALPEKTPIPVFPIVRRLCDEAILAASAQTASRLDVRIDSRPDCLSIELKLGAAAIAPSGLEQIKAFLAELALGDDILQHFVEPGGNRYVVQAAIR